MFFVVKIRIKMNKKPSTLILTLVISLAVFNAIIISPALPAIAHYFSVSDAFSQFSLTFFLAGYALSQLIIAPFGNAWGRKKSLIIFLLLGILATVLSLVGISIHSYDTFILARLFAGIGTAAGLSLTYTMINDVYNEKDARRVTGYIVMAFAISPGIAAMLGGVITQHIGWQGTIYFLLIYNIFILGLTLLLPETVEKKDLIKLKITTTLKRYVQATFNKRVILLAFTYASMTSITYAFAALSPFIGIKIIHIDSSTFGIMLFIVYLGYIGGNIIMSTYLKKLSTYKSMFLGVGVSILFSFVFLIFFLFGAVNVWTLFIPAFFIYSAMPYIYANASVKGISAHYDKATASSMLNFISMSSAFITTFILGFFPVSFIIVLPIAILVLSLLCLSFLTTAYRTEHR